MESVRTIVGWGWEFSPRGPDIHWPSLLTDRVRDQERYRWPVELWSRKATHRLRFPFVHTVMVSDSSGSASAVDLLILNFDTDGKPADSQEFTICVHVVFPFLRSGEVARVHYASQRSGFGVEQQATFASVSSTTILYVRRDFRFIFDNSKHIHTW